MNTFCSMLGINTVRRKIFTALVEPVTSSIILSSYNGLDELTQSHELTASDDGLHCLGGTFVFQSMEECMYTFINENVEKYGNKHTMSAKEEAAVYRHKFEESQAASLRKQGTSAP